ncbi:hypothetical protein ABZW02_20135 [Streptomyces sp. NPDC005180]|uniref:hypothetical protein n=1 Tax=Streptomyces sp. NPDC005180 TaxID=3156868 RepID=UPI0033A198F1
MRKTQLKVSQALPHVLDVFAGESELSVGELVVRMGRRHPDLYPALTSQGLGLWLKAAGVPKRAAGQSKPRYVSAEAVRAALLARTESSGAVSACA